MGSRPSCLRLDFPRKSSRRPSSSLLVPLKPSKARQTTSGNGKSHLDQGHLLTLSLPSSQCQMPSERQRPKLHTGIPGGGEGEGGCIGLKAAPDHWVGELRRLVSGPCREPMPPCRAEAVGLWVVKCGGLLSTLSSRSCRRSRTSVASCSPSVAQVSEGQ